MSITLDNGSTPPRTEAKSYRSEDPVAALSAKYGDGGYVRIRDQDGGHEFLISMKDILVMTTYALINTNIEGDQDPRLAFVEQIKQMRLVPGYEDGVKGAQRLTLGTM